MAAPSPSSQVDNFPRPDAWHRRFWWRSLHVFFWTWFKLCYRYRHYGVANIPPTGPVIFLCSHQSFCDPVIVGLAVWRRSFYAMARATLFTTPGLGWFIRSINAFPINRGQTDMAAMRHCLDILRRGYGLLVFPEGTRTHDGSVQSFAPGTLLLIRRSKALVIPVAIEGAYQVWPRQRKRPRLFGRIGVAFGPPISADTITGMPPEEALRMLQQKVEALRQETRRNLDGRPDMA